MTYCWLSEEMNKMPWCVRSIKAFARLEIKTLDDLCSHYADEFMSLKNFGESSLREIRVNLASVGRSLKDEEEITPLKTKGSSQRALFAAMAMQGLCSRSAHHKPEDIIPLAIAMADALIAELSKP